jgi:hypothetical protein
LKLSDRLRARGGSSADQTEAILGRHLDLDFRVFPMAEKQATPPDIQAIGQRFGVSYPSQFVAHVCGKFPGIYVEVKEEIWPRPKAYDVGPFWSFLYALHTYTPSAQSDDWMRLDKAAESFRTETNVLAAPILRVVGDADLYCVDAKGDICQWQHETNELVAVDLDFWALFEREIAELFERKVMKLASKPE